MSESDTISGYIRHLDEIRSVWIGAKVGQFFVRFVNAESEETKLRMTPEALEALCDIYREHYFEPSKDPWTCVEPEAWEYVAETEEK